MKVETETHTHNEESSPSVSAEASATLRAELPGPVDYQIVSGDTLSSIAEAHGINWEKLYESNRTVVEVPDWVFPGEVIVVVV